MSKLRIAALKDNVYRPELRKGPIMMCDLLGFSNHTRNTALDNLSNDIINLLDILNSMSTLDFGMTK